MSKKTNLTQVRHFSVDLKKTVVTQIEQGDLSVTQASRSYGVAPQTVYNWLYKYSSHLKKGVRLVVEKESIGTEMEALKRRINELEAALGRKSLESDLYGKIIELASQELDLDLKKNFGSQVSTPSPNPQ